MKTKCLVLLLLFLLGPAWAAPILDGGFESGAFGSGWTDLDGNASFGSTPHTGAQALGFPDLSGGGSVFTGSIQQNLTTVAGQFYTLSFFLDNTSGTDNNDLSVFFDGSPLMSGPMLLSAGYTQFSFTGLQATGPTTSLIFALGSGDGEVRLDDVDVQVEGAPEISAGLAGLPCALLLGLLLIVQSGRRQLKAKE